MFKLILGAVSLAAAGAGIFEGAPAAVLAAPLALSGAYILNLYREERLLNQKNNRLGIITKENMPELSFEEKKIDRERQEFLLERYDKAREDFLALKDAKTKTRDKALRNQLDKMEKIAGRFLTYLSENPEKIPTASKFIDYYQDRALMLVNRYFELTETGLNTPEVNERRQKVVSALFLMDEAYEAEFHKALSAEFMDIDAEIEVIEGNMKGAGITESIERDEKDVTPNILPPDLKGTTSERMAQRKRLIGYKGDTLPVYDKKDVVTRKVIQSGLAIFLGSFGAHKFYLGKTFQGALYCLFFWTLIPALLGVFEGVRYLVMPVGDYYAEYYVDLKNKNP